LHGIGATLGFKFGFLYQGEWSVTALIFGLYFGIVYAAGHLNHEITDFDSDKKSGVPTHAVLFGKLKAFQASFILFSVSFLYIFILSVYGILPSFLIFAIAIVYPFYLFFYIGVLRKKLNYTSMINFRTQYRILFFIWGIVLAIGIAA
jgi:1,4-dihydroxy-2-naphthoate octaprenyltransferase